MSNTFFNLFSSWRRVPPLVVWGVAPFHGINIASPKNLGQQKFLLVTIDSTHLGRRYWLMRRARAIAWKNPAVKFIFGELTRPE